MFENRHFDTKKQSWYIGEDYIGRQKINCTIDKFFEQLTHLINVSEEIRDINAQMNKIKDINEDEKAGSIGPQSDKKDLAMVMEEIMNHKTGKLNLSPQQSKSNKKFFGSSLKNVGGPLGQLVNKNLNKMQNTLDRPIEEVDDEDEVDKMASQADMKIRLDTRNSKILDENVTPKIIDPDKPIDDTFNQLDIPKNLTIKQNVVGRQSEVVILKNQTELKEGTHNVRPLAMKKLFTNNMDM